MSDTPQSSSYWSEGYFKLESENEGLVDRIAESEAEVLSLVDRVINTEIARDWARDWAAWLKRENTRLEARVVELERTYEALEGVLKLYQDETWFPGKASES